MDRSTLSAVAEMRLAEFRTLSAAGHHAVAHRVHLMLQRALTPDE